RVALQVIFSEPPSLFSIVKGRLNREGRAAMDKAGTMMNTVRKLRARVGRNIERYSFAPEQRLLRSTAKILPPMVCVDVGASYYPHPAWEVFRRSPRTTWLAVEPNSKNTQYLN